jgi:hypothetical protein
MDRPPDQISNCDSSHGVSQSHQQLSRCFLDNLRIIHRTAPLIYTLSQINLLISGSFLVIGHALRRRIRTALLGCELQFDYLFDFLCYFHFRLDTYSRGIALILELDVNLILYYIGNIVVVVE